MGLVFTAMGGSLTISEFYDTFLFYLVISMMIILFGSLIFIFGRYKLLIELMPPDQKGILRFAMTLAVVLIIIGFILIPYYYNDLKGTYEDEDEEIDEENVDKLQATLQDFQAETIGLTIIYLILGMVTEVLFIICFYLAYDYQKTNPKARRGMTPPPGH